MFLTLFRVSDYAVARKISIPVADYELVKDSAFVYSVKVVEVYDVVGYDYVPHMDPRDDQVQLTVRQRRNEDDNRVRQNNDVRIGVGRA